MVEEEEEEQQNKEGGSELHQQPSWRLCPKAKSGPVERLKIWPRASQEPTLAGKLKGN